ncbi:MAG: ABC transporter ATP-binding protein, partial [Oscillospiraceae bacterium]|nr:ABC transporter ATP-binding protein [Oscillospiraceae bacterium]
LDSLRGLGEILQYGAGGIRLEQMNSRSDDLSRVEKRMKSITGHNMAVTNAVILVFDLIMLFYGSVLVQNGSLTFDGMIISFVALISSFGPVIALSNLGSTLQNTFAAGGRVLDILDEIPVVEEQTAGCDIVFDGAKAENVTFAYNDEEILSDFSVDISKDKITGIVGKSGSGKSTLLKLLMRFWDTDRGSIRISDEDIKNINTYSLRTAESYMTQQTYLFHDTVANNLRIAKQDATDEEIIAACKKASVHDFIMSLENGYETVVGELGSTLSGGERQRLGLAMAFLHDAPFMLLDEPTSNLDSLNEAIILKSLHQQKQGKTVVLVSHRQSTMKIADNIYNVEKGRLS